MLVVVVVLVVAVREVNPRVQASASVERSSGNGQARFVSSSCVGGGSLPRVLAKVT